LSDLLEFGMLVTSGSTEARQWLKYLTIQGEFSVFNSAADCSVSRNFGTEFHHVTTDTLQSFKVKGTKVNVIP